jgi:hypothetical protein
MGDIPQLQNRVSKNLTELTEYDPGCRIYDYLKFKLI